MGNTATPSFPQLGADLMRTRLALPEGPVRLLIDTDAANEIDDQFAIAWALLSQDRLRIEAVTAAPFSFAHHRAGLLAAEAQLDARARGDAIDEQLVGGFQGWVERLHRQGRRAENLEFCGPEEGMERSYQEILRVYRKLGLEPGNQVVRGATAYLVDFEAPRPSPAIDAIVDLAKSGDAPLYVVAIGCITNVAAALLRAPEIVRDIVVVWTSAYPSSAPHCNRPSMNLVQDPLASRLIFDCGVPHVYLPGYHVGAQLRVSLPEMEAFVRGRSAIGDYLVQPLRRQPVARHVRDRGRWPAHLGDLGHHQHRLAAEPGLGADVSDPLAGAHRSAVLAPRAGPPPDARGLGRAARRHLHRPLRQDCPRPRLN